MQFSLVPCKVQLCTSAKVPHAGGNMAKLAPLVQQGRLTGADMRWFVGESVWSKGQLEYELARGTWAAVQVPVDQLHPLRCWAYFLMLSFWHLCSCHAKALSCRLRRGSSGVLCHAITLMLHHARHVVDRRSALAGNMIELISQ